MKRTALLAELAGRICALRPPHPLRVAIDGVDAAGKTTLADELAGAVGSLGRPVIRASVDAFHRPAKLRHQRGRLSPEGYYRDTFDYAALLGSLLEPLGPGGSLEYRTASFDRAADRPLDAPLERAPGDAVLLLDGIFLLRPELFSHWDVSIFVHADFEVTVPRALRRDPGDPAETRRRYRERYVPGQRIYLAECRPHARCSLLVVNDDPPAAELRVPRVGAG